MSEDRRHESRRDEGADEHDLILPVPAEGPEVEIVSFGDDDDPEGIETAGVTDEEADRLAAELAEARDLQLRLRADFDNYRKRVERERDERARRALAEPMFAILPVIDNLERALAATGGADELRDGVELILRQLLEVLRGFGVSEIPALGRPFDPEIHEAVAREEDPGVEVPTVAAELQRGYWLNDRLLRPAMVRVAMPPDSAETASAAGAEDRVEESS